jgi:hypothetical protein
MSNLTHLQGRNPKVKFMSRILERSSVGSETGPDPKPDPGPKPTVKKDRDPKETISDPQQ